MSQKKAWWWLRIRQGFFAREFYVDACPFRYPAVEGRKACLKGGQVLGDKMSLSSDNKLSIDLSDACEHRISPWPFRGCTHRIIIVNLGDDHDDKVICGDRCKRVCGISNGPSVQHEPFEDCDYIGVRFCPTRKLEC